MDLRPYYHRFAWAYDLLNAEPIVARVEFIVDELRRRGARPPARLLDSGCGTGRYAVDLAGRGFAVTGVDQSAELVDIARAKGPRAGGVEFSVANLLSFDPPDRYAAVLCRGVLNDVIADADRATIFCRFAQWLSPGGVLMLDVRDWARSAARYAAGPTGRREIRLPDGAVLAFTSETSLDHAARRLAVRERFEHRRGTEATVAESEFSMRCWSREEICQRMAGQFTDLAIRTGYGEHDTAWTDRLVAIATRAGR
jgi:SAM-dependent methyltransferase